LETINSFPNFGFQFRLLGGKGFIGANQASKIIGGSQIPGNFQALFIGHSVNHSGEERPRGVILVISNIILIRPGTDQFFWAFNFGLGANLVGACGRGFGGPL